MPPRLVVLPVCACAASLLWAAARLPAAEPADKPAAWEKLASGPEARYALQTVWASKKKRLLAFGGETNPDFKILDDLWAFSPADGKWAELKPEGKKPARRAYYAACFDDKRKGMWLHGGFNPDFLD